MRTCDRPSFRLTGSRSYRSPEHNRRENSDQTASGTPPSSEIHGKDRRILQIILDTAKRLLGRDTGLRIHLSAMNAGVAIPEFATLPHLISKTKHSSIQIDKGPVAGAIYLVCSWIVHDTTLEPPARDGIKTGRVVNKSNIK